MLFEPELCARFGTGKIAALAELRKVPRREIFSLGIVLRRRADIPKPRHRFFEELPAKVEAALVDIDDFVDLRIDGKRDLAYDWPVVDACCNLVDGNAVVRFVVFECPINRVHATITRQRAVMYVDDPTTLVDKPLTDDLVVGN